VGALGWYGIERLRGNASELPTLTAYFSNGASAPTPLLDDLPAVPPEEDGPLAPDRLPEPWRTATRTVLATGVPDGLGLDDRSDARDAMDAIDALWLEHGDAEAALEIAAIGADQRARAISRAMSAGDDAPEAYASHRRYLPGSAALQAYRFVGRTLALATALDLGWPVQGAHRISSPFGYRVHPTLKTRKFHNGTDLAVPIGTPVHATQAATVAIAGENSTSGKYLVLDHGNGVRTAYCHLDRHDVVQGAHVERGEAVALSGNTGRSTGPHLHYIVRIGGTPVDPERFRRADDGV
jgi:murein DD-endopeptidase MepM/ murein hydrolase activator NlpD